MVWGVPSPLSEVVAVAQKVEVVLTCDLDEHETPAVETVVFGYDGQTYEFELCQDHLDEFHKVVGGLAAAARRTGSAHRRSASAIGVGPRASRGRGDPSELAAVRQWARNHGFEISDRGRIPAQVREAYEAAQR